MKLKKEDKIHTNFMIQAELNNIWDEAPVMFNEYFIKKTSNIWNTYFGDVEEINEQALGERKKDLMLQKIE